MQNLTMEGTGTIDGGEYGRVRINGMARCTGDMKSESLDVDGVFRCQGSVQTGGMDIDGIFRCAGSLRSDSLDIDGMFKCQGSVQTGNLACDGMATVYGDIKADAMKIEGILTVKGGTRIEAGTIICEGIIRIEGEVSADRIESNGIIVANEIVGDSITIRSRHFRSFFPLFKPSRSRIALIEATTVDLRGVVAHTVNGRDMVIGRGCHIDNLDCSGDLCIMPGARVGNITGNYRMKNG